MIGEDLTSIIDEVLGLNNNASRDRPYNGQPHTQEGERGKTLVEGLTMRDVADCMAIGLLQVSGIPELYDAVERGVWTYKDLYKLEDFDPVAAIQCMGCQLEKMMGIYPNVPELIFEGE
jgi:hypothetical protein